MVNGAQTLIFWPDFHFLGLLGFLAIGFSYWFWLLGPWDPMGGAHGIPWGVPMGSQGGPMDPLALGDPLAHGPGPMDPLALGDSLAHGPGPMGPGPMHGTRAKGP